jgi:deoxycytidine triphosphate deaminase
LILTDREIRTAIERGSIVIDPRPATTAYSSTSVDLTLDPVFSIFKDHGSHLDIANDPAKPGFNPEALLSQLAEPHTAGPDGFRLQPHTLVLAWTAEYVDLR